MMAATEGGPVPQRSCSRIALLGTVCLLSGLAITQTGCINESPPPDRMPVPSAGNRDQSRERDYVRPMPPDDWRDRRSRDDSRPDDPPPPRP